MKLPEILKRRPRLASPEETHEHQVVVRLHGHGQGDVFLDGQKVKGVTGLSFMAGVGEANWMQLTLATASLEFEGPASLRREHRPHPAAMPPETFMLEDFYVRRLGETPHARGMAVLYRRVGEADTVVRRIPKPQWERHAVQVRDYLEAAA